MAAASDSAQQAQWKRWRAVADLYHAYFTGLILTVVTRRGTADAAEFVFRVFRRQQQERFLAGLEKLGLSHLPPAVAAAQYHYLSNWIGGVDGAGVACCKLAETPAGKGLSQLRHGICA